MAINSNCRGNQERSAGSSNIIKSSSDDASGTLFKLLFEEIVEGARCGRIKPFACICIPTSLSITTGGVKKVMTLFLKSYKHSDEIKRVSLTFGTDNPIVVELTR